jgi:hypothetical protein
MWTIEQVTTLTNRTSGEAVGWTRDGDGALHAEEDGQELILRRHDDEGISLETVTAGTAPSPEALAQSEMPGFAETLEGLWQAASSSAPEHA